MKCTTLKLISYSTLVSDPFIKKMPDTVAIFDVTQQVGNKITGISSIKMAKPMVV